MSCRRRTGRLERGGYRPRRAESVHLSLRRTVTAWTCSLSPTSVFRAKLDAYGAGSRSSSAGQNGSPHGDGDQPAQPSRALLARTIRRCPRCRGADPAGHRRRAIWDMIETRRAPARRRIRGTRHGRGHHADPLRCPARRAREPSTGSSTDVPAWDPGRRTGPRGVLTGSVGLKSLAVTRTTGPTLDSRPLALTG